VGVCAHELLEWQEHEDEMHCLGWICRECRQVQLGECHHGSWCREDFCGAAPVAEVALAFRLASAF
jgi:hypothetical protein